MAQSIPFGARSTADQVLAGVDLTRKRMVVTGCESGIGLETMKALAANGAHIIGLARTIDDARAACNAAGASSTPIACDLSDCASIDSTADLISNLAGPLDAIITNTDLADPPVPTRRYGIELQTIAEYIGHFALVNRLSHRVRENGGRIVLATNDASMNHALTEAITKELSRRLAARGVSVNSWDSGSVRGAGLDRHPGWTRRQIYRVARLFIKSAAQRAATAALLAASPLAAGISGEHWSRCQITHSDPLLADEILIKRFWETSEQIFTAIRATYQIAPRAVARNSAGPDQQSLIGLAKQV
jgi:WW domain-containing oxidoreductase